MSLESEKSVFSHILKFYSNALVPCFKFCLCKNLNDEEVLEKAVNDLLAEISDDSFSDFRYWVITPYPRARN